MFRCLLERIVIKVGVALCGRWLGVTEQLANYRQAQPYAGADRGMGVAEIVNPDVLKPGALGDGLPWFFEVGSGLFVVGASRRAGDDIGTNLRQSGQDRQGRRVQHDGLFAGLTRRQKKKPAFEIDVLPPQMQDLSEAWRR